ncbi:MAG: 6-bladed beta-propeller [Candidatus Sabulitectum sp.]|nr:6-bladed beta-propeller [Candidatus Sabulitectum sp.]
MGKMTIFISILFLLTLVACGNMPDPDDASADAQQTSEDETTFLTMPEIDHWLAITDSIGVELGDSNLVFGQIVNAQFLPGGNIAIADMMKTKISIFSQQGEFLATVGRKGSGPGEYLVLSTFAVTEHGGFIVPDAMGGKLNFYDSEYNFISAMTGFFPTPPIMISSVDGGFVGLKPEFEQSEDEMNIGMGLYLWTDSSSHDIEYTRNMVLFDMNDLTSSVKTMVFFDTDRNGHIFTAPYSTEEYVITSLSMDGEEVWQIIEDFQRVRKTDEEIEEEREILRSGMAATGTPPSMADHFQIEEHKVFIGGLTVDSKNRLWVYNTLYDTPVFRVYDCDTGEFLFTAALRTEETHENVTLSISRYGILGFEPNSDNWPRVYIITPEDTTLFE